MACGKAGDSNVGNVPAGSGSATDKLGALIATGTVPDLDHMTFTVPERDSLKARLAADPSQFLVVTSDGTTEQLATLAKFSGKVLVITGLSGKTDLTAEQASALAAWPATR